VRVCFHKQTHDSKNTITTANQLMRIGSYIKQSFIDWENRISAVVFTKGCNFLCGYCHNPALVLPELINQGNDIPEEEVLNYLESRKNWLDGVVITGGEPTLQQDLQKFILEIKNMGFPVKLDTNGSNPMVLKNLLDARLIDFVAMDVKTLLNPMEYQKITQCKSPLLIENILKSLTLLNTSGIDYQLRTTLIPGHHSREIVKELKKQINTHPHIFQEFRAGETIGASILFSDPQP